MSPKTKSLNLKIVFMGTPEFGAIILEKLCQSGYKPVFVVTAPDKPVDRKQVITPPPVKISAEKNNILLLQPENLPRKIQIENQEPDLIITAAYGKILPKEILTLPKYGSLNVHPSLLPKYRGPSPIQFAILNGERENGITIIKMTEKVDAGPIVASKKIKKENEKISYQELHDELARAGGELLVETIPNWVQGKIKTKPQDELKASYSKILKKEDGKLDWHKPASVLEKEIRAFYNWPGSYAIWQDKERPIKIKILKARVFKFPSKTKYPLGKVLVVPQNEIGIQCKEDFLAVEILQPEGKKEMVAEDFLRGHLGFMGAILE